MYNKRLNDQGLRESSFYSSNQNPFFASNYGMPNCTCYSYGRAFEILGKKPEGLSLKNAKYWYNESTNFEKGQTPKLGAIMCFDGQYGHINVVEEIKENGDLVCSNSNYGGDYFFLSNHTKDSGYNNYDKTLKFQGFIYVYRGTDENGEINNSKSIEEMAREVINGNWGNGQERKDKLTKSGYDYNSIQNKVNEIIGQNNIKSIESIAQEVIRGNWGNGQERKERLVNAGYDYNVVQNKVKELLK